MLYMIANHGRETATMRIDGAQLVIEPGRHVFLGLDHPPRVSPPLMVVPLERPLAKRLVKRGPRPTYG